MTLYLLKFNNYYNRIIKRFSSISEYQNNSKVLAIFENIKNFTPNDGIDTKHVLNYTDTMEPDYLIVEDDTNNEILSRWFIIDAIRTRAGQYEVTLHRDVIADNLDEVMAAPVFVEKATIRDQFDPAIYNNESMTFNQIKKGEYLLKDKSKVPWIVGYIPKNFPDSNKVITAPSTTNPSDINADFTVSSLSDWQYYSYIGIPIVSSYEYESSINFKVAGEVSALNYIVNFGSAESLNYQYNSISSTSYYSFNTYGSLYALDSNFERIFNTHLTTNQFSAEIDSYIKSNNTYISLSTLQALDGQTIFNTSTNKLYTISINFYQSETKNSKISELANIGNSLMNKSTAVGYYYNFSNYGNISDTWSFSFLFQNATITLIEKTTKLKTSFISANSRSHTTDNVFDMFCIPFGSIIVRNNSDDLTSTFTTTTNGIMNLVSSISQDLGSASIYDIQLLPYCPIDEIINYDTGVLDIYKYPETKYSLITNENDDNKNILVWCENSTFTKTIPRPTGIGIPSGIFSTYQNILDKKVKNETQFVRITSPNYSGIFEFNPMKNNGVKYFRISCSYKPYTPYIHVAPIFKEDSLYGGDYNDARGLICGGDFSLPQITSAWANYQLNNKNYQLQFDRQIENMELNNSIQREQQLWNIATGALSAGVSSGMAGSMVGGGWGAAIGGVVGGGTSLAGGIRDYQLSEISRAEALDFAKDNFGYNLQNIQALPYSLNKVSPFNSNNKIFPFLEFFGCSDVEEEALRNKLKFNGMTIMRIGSMNEFVQYDKSYFKGKLIRLENVGDSHLVNTIASELDKGVFI